MSQTSEIYALLSKGPVRTDQIQKVVYGSEHLGLCRIPARVGDIKKQYGVPVYGWRDPQVKSLYWYSLTPKGLF